MKEIRYRLTAWGHWAGTRVGTEYPVSSWPVPIASSDIRPMLPDNEAQIVDRQGVLSGDRARPQTRP